jgi:TatD DNase family protein
LCDAVFDADRSEVLVRAAAAGIRAIVAVGEDLADAAKNLALARQFPVLKPAAGLYPSHLDAAAAATLENFIRANHAALAAIGEVGLDFWAALADEARALQQEIFTRFVALAIELDLPLNVHSRSAGRRTVELLMRCGAPRVQLHAFDGKASAALPAVEAGYFFSIPPSVVRSRQKQKLVRRLPLDCLLVESDSPVLGPDPRERNEPANLAVAIRAIAEIKALPEAQVVEAVAANTIKLYGF